MTLKFNRALEVVEIHVRAKFHQAKCSGSWVLNSALDFGQLLHFDREYLWNRSSNRQAENGVFNYYFVHVRWKQLQNFVETVYQLDRTCKWQHKVLLTNERVPPLQNPAASFAFRNSSPHCLCSVVDAVLPIRSVYYLSPVSSSWTTTRPTTRVLLRKKLRLMKDGNVCGA